MSEGAHDQRLLRGARSRKRILQHAVDVASLDGLDGLSFGRLAADLGVSKAGIQTLFGTKENLQVAVAEAAREEFEEAVTRPARAQPPGVARLRVLVDRWIAYAEEPLFPGGCFWAANLPVFDSQPGPVRDILARQQRAWRGLIAAELRHAADTAQIAALDADLAAFQVDAVLTAANTALRLDDTSAVDTARRIINGFLGELGDLAASLGPEAEEAYVTTAEMLRAEGEARWRTEERAEALVDVLAARLGPLDESVPKKVRAASLAQMRAWTTRAATAKTLDEVFR